MGVSHSTVIHTKTQAGKNYDKKKVERRKKRAEQCFKCEHNQAGFCKSIGGWCFNVQSKCSKCIQHTIKPAIKPNHIPLTRSNIEAINHTKQGVCKQKKVKKRG